MEKAQNCPGGEGLVDLHTHTTASDGTLTPRQLVEYAREKGLAAVAVTDHDTVSGLGEALAAGEELGLPVAPGVELSSCLEGREIHVVGLFIDPGEPGLLALRAEMRRERLRRNRLLLEKLAGLGIPIPPEEVLAAAPGGVLTRTHVAEAMVRRGAAGSIVEALEEYLSPGGPAWVEKRGPDPARCVSAIHRAGGLAVLAHLNRICPRDPERGLRLAGRALDAGMDGLEVRYATYTPQWEEWAEALCRERGLLPSGGSDFHGARKKNDLGTGLGNLRVPEGFWAALAEAARQRRRSGKWD